MTVIKGIFFDLNGTLIDICTDEGCDDLYRVCSNYLSYYGVFVEPAVLRGLYFDLNRRQRQGSKEEYPEFDISRIFYDVIALFAPSMPETEKKTLSVSSSVVFRAASRFRLNLYSDVKAVLDQLSSEFVMAAVSDGQSLWAVPEMRAAGLGRYFSTVIVSGDLGFRKPDKRMFEAPLKKLGLLPEEVIYVGNDMYRDVYGGACAGMKTVFFKSNQGDHEYHGVEADYIIYNFAQLPEAVEFLQNKERKMQS